VRDCSEADSRDDFEKNEWEEYYESRNNKLAWKNRDSDE